MSIKWKIKFICVVLCLAIQSANGQNADSLLNLLHKTSKDSSKVNIMISLGRMYLQSANMVESRKWIDQAMSLAQKTKDVQLVQKATTALGGFYHRQGTIYHSKSNFPEALNNYFIAVKIFEKLGDKEKMGLSLGNIGLVYWEEYNYSEALKYQNNALQLFKEIDNKIRIAGTYNNIGLVYENSGDHEQALKNYFEAIELYKQFPDKSPLIDRYFNIGFLYEDQGKFEEAAKYHLMAEALCKELNNNGGLAAAQANLGELYYHQALSISDPVKKEKLLRDAYDYLIKSLKLSEKLQNNGGLYTVMNDMAAICYEQKNYSDSKKFLDSSLAITKQSGDVSALKDVYELKWRLDSASGSWQNAFNDHKFYIFYRDSIYNQESSRKIMKAQIQFDFDKKEDSLKYLELLTNERLNKKTLLAEKQKQDLLLKEKELEVSNNVKQIQQLQIKNAEAGYAVQKAEADKKLLLLSQEKNYQGLELNKQKQVKNYLLGGLLLLVVLSFFIYRNYRTRNQLKLQTLRNKIASDLHDDVGSTLSSISIFSQMAQQQSRDVVPMLETIGESSRKMLDAMADIVWTINPENDQFEKIILRMKSFAYELLGASKIDFEFVADETVAKINVPMEVRKNLYLIFKEATNNLVKYSHASKVMFAITGEKNLLTMMIQDDGKGFDLKNTTPGNGLKNMMRRASEIGGKLVIESFPGIGTTIQLNVAV